MRTDALLNKLEKELFMERRIGVASPSGYIDVSTWKRFRATTKIRNVTSEALIPAFDEQAERFDSFVRENPKLTRSVFDRFHERKVNALFKHFRKHHPLAKAHPAAAGTIHGDAYNPYAKFVNLAHT